MARTFPLKELMQLDMAEAPIYKVSRRKKSGTEEEKKDEGKKGRKNVLSGYNFYSVAGIIEYYIAVFTCLFSRLYFWYFILPSEFSINYYCFKTFGIEELRIIKKTESKF